MESFLRYIDVVLESKLQHFAQAQLLVQLPAAPVEEVLTVQQTADLLHVTRQTVHNRVRDGKLTAYKQDPDKPGGTTYFKKTEVLAALHERVRLDGRRKYARRQFSPAKVTR